MEKRAVAGPGSGAIKYDILTALSLAGMSAEALRPTTALRLIALITARYDWRRDEVTVGQTEIARMWGVSLRTVKREMQDAQTLGILICVRPAARGRVAGYRLGYAALSTLTQTHWGDVGPDYADRMGARYQPPAPETTVVRVDFGAPTMDGPGAAALHLLAGRAPDRFRNWYARLQVLREEEGALIFAAPSAFIARYVETQLAGELLAAVQETLGPTVQRVVIETR